VTDGVNDCAAKLRKELPPDRPETELSELAPPVIVPVVTPVTPVSSVNVVVVGALKACVGANSRPDIKHSPAKVFLTIVVLKITVVFPELISKILKSKQPSNVDT
jgi:hypothetical protein